MNAHPLWPWFVKYVEHNGISLVAEEDWKDWWQCFLDGAAASREYEIEQEKYTHSGYK